MNLINNRKRLLFASDKKFYNFFQDEMSINIRIDNLTNFLTLFTKKLLSNFSMQLVHEIYAIWKIFHFTPFPKGFEKLDDKQIRRRYLKRN